MRSRDEHLAAIKADVLRDPVQKRSDAERNSSNGRNGREPAED